jgi:predicted membrane protein
MKGKNKINKVLLKKEVVSGSYWLVLKFPIYGFFIAFFVLTTLNGVIALFDDSLVYGFVELIIHSAIVGTFCSILLAMVRIRDYRKVKCYYIDKKKLIIEEKEE